MLYRWPQGRIIRVVAMILVALIAFDFGSEAWGSYKTIFDSPTAASLTTKIVFGVLVTFTVGVAVSGFYLIGFHSRSAQFLIEVESEMTKVTWPTRAELIRLTIVIAILSLILTGLIFTVDVINKTLKDLLFSLGPTMGGS